jgi:hypothetical protein
MPGTLVFEVNDDLKALVDHVEKSPEVRPNFVDLYDPGCRIDGKEPDEDHMPTESEIDPKKIARGLWMVTDQGVYLMSPGKPAIPGANGSMNLVVYAQGCNPHIDEDYYDNKRMIMGGDDGVDKVPLDFLKNAISNGAHKLIIKISETEYAMEAV